jgi:excisionase family DNA binding protein
MADPLERHLKTGELAELLAVHPETIRRLAASGELPSVRVGSERRYPESGVLDYLRRHREDAA